jgi:hypothetical protein
LRVQGGSPWRGPLRPWGLNEKGEVLAAVRSAFQERQPESRWGLGASPGGFPSLPYIVTETISSRLQSIPPTRPTQANLFNRADLDGQKPRLQLCPTWNSMLSLIGTGPATQSAGPHTIGLASLAFTPKLWVVSGRGLRLKAQSYEHSTTAPLKQTGVPLQVAAGELSLAPKLSSPPCALIPKRKAVLVTPLPHASGHNWVHIVPARHTSPPKRLQ